MRRFCSFTRSGFAASPSSAVVSLAASVAVLVFKLAPRSGVTAKPQMQDARKKETMLDFGVLVFMLFNEELFPGSKCFKAHRYDFEAWGALLNRHTALRGRTGEL